jgi:hypothetical protein
VIAPDQAEALANYILSLKTNLIRTRTLINATKLIARSLCRLPLGGHWDGLWLASFFLRCIKPACTGYGNVRTARTPDAPSGSGSIWIETS